MGKKILYAEDEPGISDAVKMLMEHAGYQVMCCDNGRDILPAIDSFKPDMLVMDLMMPGIDGVGVLRQLNTDSEKSKIPVLICSALPDARPMLDEFRQMRGFLMKPFKAAELLAAMKEALSTPVPPPPSDGN